MGEASIVSLLVAFIGAAASVLVAWIAREKYGAAASVENANTDEGNGRALPGRPPSKSILARRYMVVALKIAAILFLIAIYTLSLINLWVHYFFARKDISATALYLFSATAAISIVLVIIIAVLPTFKGRNS